MTAWQLLKAYGEQVFIAFDQLANALIPPIDGTIGYADETLMPAAGTAAEQDHMVYGKRQNSAFDLPGFARYAHTMTLESW